MRITKENKKLKSKQEKGPEKGSNPSTHPCAASSSEKHKLLDLLWSFGPAFQRWSESQMTYKGLSTQRLRILESLYDRGSRKMCDLKDELGVTATNITALVDALEKDGFVERKAHPTDRRATVIELSAKAQSDLALGCEEYKNRVAEIFSGLTEKECREFASTLEKLWDRIHN